MEIAAYMSMSLNEFWDMTPYEFSIFTKGFFARKKNERDESITLSYLNAMWTIQWLSSDKKDRPQPLEKILGIKKEKKVMSSEQMLAQVKQLNALFGGSEVENG